MAYQYEKQHRDVYASMKAMWTHLFQTMWEELQAGNLDKARATRKTLEEVFENTADDACNLFLKLKEVE